MFQWLRCADPGEGIVPRGLDEIQDPEGGLPIGVDPVAEVLEALAL